MTTFAGWVQSTYAMIKHPLRGQKYDLKHAREPVVHGFRESSSQRSKSPSSDIHLYTLGNRTVRQYSEDKASGTAPIVATSPKRVMSPPSAVSNPSRSDNNGGWLHTHWKPGQVKAGIDFFERVAAASVQGAPVRPSSPTASIKVKRPAAPPPEPPKPVVVSRHGKTKRAPLPPQPAAQAPLRSSVTNGTSAPAKTFAPPPAPPMDGLKVLQRAHSAPPMSPPNMAAVFAELKGHKLVQRSDSAPETMGTASETRAASGGRQISAKSWLPRRNGPMDATLQELKSSKQMPKEAKPIEVKPEVKAQAEALRARLKAERNAAQSVPSRWNEDSGLPKPKQIHTYLSNGRLAPTTEQKSLVDELKAAQAALKLKARHLQNG